MNSDSIVVSNLVTVSANFPGFQFSDRVTLSFTSDSHPFFATFFPNPVNKNPPVKVYHK